MKKKSVIVSLWNCLWPLLIYQAAQYLFAILGTILIVAAVGNQGTSEEAVMTLYYQYAILFMIAAALVCIPVYHRMYHKDKKRLHLVKHDVPVKGRDYLAIIVSGAALALATNSLISITPLPFLFSGYEEVNDVIYGGGIILQILGAGILGCIVEELSLRGITFVRMKQEWGRKTAIVFSAVIFGIYHMNVVQAVYAFVLGLFFAWVYDRYETIWAPIIAHMSANLFVILLSGSELIMNVMNTLIGYCLCTGISLILFFYGWRYMRQNDPAGKLPLEEKEPDNLTDLAREYQEKKSGEEST